VPQFTHIDAGRIVLRKPVGASAVAENRFGMREHRGQHARRRGGRPRARCPSRPSRTAPPLCRGRG